MVALRRRRRRLMWTVLALCVLEAGCCVVCGMRLRDTPLTVAAPVVVLAGAWLAWKRPVAMAGLLALFAALMTPHLATVASGGQSPSVRFYAALATVGVIPLLAAALLLLSGDRRTPFALWPR